MLSFQSKEHRDIHSTVCHTRLAFDSLHNHLLKSGREHTGRSEYLPQILTHRKEWLSRNHSRHVRVNCPRLSKGFDNKLFKAIESEVAEFHASTDQQTHQELTLPQPQTRQVELSGWQKQVIGAYIAMELLAKAFPIENDWGNEITLRPPKDTTGFRVLNNRTELKGYNDYKRGWDGSEIVFQGVYPQMSDAVASNVKRAKHQVRYALCRSGTRLDSYDLQSHLTFIGQFRYPNRFKLYDKALKERVGYRLNALSQLEVNALVHQAFETSLKTIDEWKPMERRFENQYIEGRYHQMTKKPDRGSNLNDMYWQKSPPY